MIPKNLYPNLNLSFKKHGKNRKWRNISLGLQTKNENGNIIEHNLTKVKKKYVDNSSKKTNFLKKFLI